MENRIDLNDAFVSPFFVLASGVQARLFELVLFGFDFASSVMVIGSGPTAITISAAKVISILAIGVAIATNKPDLDSMGAVQTWTAIATIGLVLAPPFSPMLESLIQSSAIAGIVALVVQSAGYYTLSYLG